MAQELITPASAAWRVKYNDGTELALFKEDGSESAFKEIEWSKASEITFESQLCKSTYSITPSRIPKNYKMSLRSRNFMAMLKGQKKTMCYILLISEEDKEPAEDTTIWAFYWFPDGTTHTCTKFDCPSVREYGIPNRQLRSIPEHHGSLQIGLDANIA